MLDRFWAVLRSQLGISWTADMMVSTGLSALAIPVFIALLANAVLSHNQRMIQYAKQIEPQQIYTAIQDWAQNAYAYVIPQYDGTGASNADAHEFCLFWSDSSKTPHFDCWRTANGQLRRYTSTSLSPGAGQPAANVAAVGNAYTIASASAAYRLASTISSPALQGKTTADALVSMGYPDTMAGNRGLIVTYDTGYLAVQVHLQTHISPSGYFVNVGTFGFGAMAVDPIKLVYTKPGDTNPTAYHASGPTTTDANGVVDVSEAHYYPVAGAPAGYGYFGINTGTCGTNATPSTTSIAANDTTPVTFSIVAQQYSTDCQMSVTDSHGTSTPVEVIVYGPLTATPTTILYTSVAAGQGGGAKQVHAHEDYYPGPISLQSSTCGSSAQISGGGNGPDAYFTVVPTAAAQCSFVIVDDHGGLQTINVTTYGVLTVTPSSITFPDPVSPAQALTAEEDFYPGVIAVNGSTCSGYATVGPGSMTTNSSWQAGFSTSPTAPTPINGCGLTFTDDHGGSVSVPVIVQNPTTTCPDGTTVGYGTPCPQPPPTPCATTCSVWYEDNARTELTTYSFFYHGATYDFVETDTLTEYTTTDGGNTWTTEHACGYYSDNKAGAYFGDAYTYCDPPNADGTSTGVYKTSAYWPYGVDQLDDPSAQSFLYVVNDTTITGQGATGTSPGTQGLCGRTITSAWNSTAPDVATLPFSPPAAENTPPAPC